MIENCEIKFQIFMSIIFDLSQIKFFVKRHQVSSEN